MHRLFILRHAKAQTHPPKASDSDHERQLAPRGRAVLPEIAHAISERLDGQPLDLVLCSTSTRTRETVEVVAQSAPAVAAARLKLDAKLYLADPARLLKTLRRVPENAATVLICGHNPGLHQLALLLLGDELFRGDTGPGDPPAGVPPRLRYDLPTAGLVVVDLDGSWTSMGNGPGATAAKLRAFVVPSDARGEGLPSDARSEGLPSDT
jgi:phosphohistidine phosphatase